MVSKTATEQGQHLVSTGKRLFGAKDNYDQLNQEIATWFYPQRADFTQELTLGEEFADHLTSSTPYRMHRDLSSALGTMMRPANQEWFKLAVQDLETDDDNPVQRHLQDMTKITSRILYSRMGNYKRAAAEADRDFTAFGCSVMSVTLNRARAGLNYKTWHLRDCAWSENEEGQVDTLYRKAMPTARGMAHMFGYENLPQDVKSNLDNKRPDAKHKILHAAIPLDMYDPRRKFPRDAQYASVYVAEDGTILQEMPEFEFPYVVSRWQTIPGWAYGISPATTVGITDARLIERVSLTIIEAAEKATDPPLIATSEAINSPIDITAGAVTWVDYEYDERLGAPLRPLDLGKNVSIGDQLLAQRELDMGSTFYLDKLNLPQGGQKTAYETSQLVQEYIRNALPLFEPMEDEVTGAQLELTVAKALRMGAYGPLEQFPEALQDKDIRFEFFNPLREARERQTLGRYEETVRVLGTASQFDPNVIHDIDVDRMTRDTLAVTGPAHWLRPKEEAAERKAQAREEADQQQDIAELQQGADAAQSVAGAATTVRDLLGGGEQ